MNKIHAAPSFGLVVLDARGRVSTWRIDALSEAHARSLAAESGYVVLRCDATRQKSLWTFLRSGVRAGSPNVVTFSQDLASLLDAGVTVKQALDTLARRAQLPAEARVLQHVNRLVAEGRSLSVGLQEVDAFPVLLVATVAASEQTGDLAVGLSRYARHQQGLRTLRDRVVGACVYPALLLVVGLLVVLLLLGVVVPRFAQVIDLQDRDLPALSHALMAWGSFASEHPGAVFLLLFAVLAGVLWTAGQAMNPRSRRRWLQAIPGARRVAREFQHLQMYRTTAILTSRGVPVQKAMEYSSDYLGPEGQLQLQASLLAMREGQSLSSAMAGSGLADEVASSMLAVAEHSSSLPETLDRIADFYERSLQRNIEIASRLIEPVLMIIFGILIGGIVLLMYLPIFDLASSVG